ncbi:hypothetical protein ACFQZ4_16420 [Catellatospora coxensis]
MNLNLKRLSVLVAAGAALLAATAARRRPRSRSTRPPSPTRAWCWTRPNAGTPARCSSPSPTGVRRPTRT